MMTGRVREALLALLLFTVVACIWWFPVLQTFSSHIAGAGGDPYQTLWRFVRLSEVLSSGSLTIPEESAVRNLGPLPWIGLVPVIGEVGAYNTAWLASAILSGWCTYLLARLWGARPGPSILAGLLVQFSPYRVSQALGHFGAMQLWWIPATLAAGVWWRRRGTLMSALLFGALIVGTAWTEHQLFLSLLIALGVTIGVWRREWIDHARRHRLHVSVIFLLFIAGAVVPFLSTLGMSADPDNTFNLGNEQRERFSATANSLFFSAPFHPFREGIEGYASDQSSTADHVHTIGVLLVLSVVIAACFTPKTWRVRSLLILAAVGIIIGLGPTAQFGLWTIPLPGALFHELPVVSALRTLGRFVNLAVIALPISLALLWPTVRRLRSASVILAIALLVEILPPLGFPRLPIDRRIPEALAHIPEGKILVIPTSTNYDLASEHLYYAATHRRHMLGNSALDRVTPVDVRRRLARTPLIGDLAFVRINDLFRRTVFGQDVRRAAAAAFASEDLRAVVLDVRDIGALRVTDSEAVRSGDERDVQRLRQFLGEDLELPEIEAPNGILTYRIPSTFPEGDGYVALRGEGWQVIERSDDASLLRMNSMAAIDIVVLPDDPRAFSFTFTPKEANDMRLVATVSGEERTVALSDGEPVILDLGTLSPGRHTIPFMLKSSNDSAVGVDGQSILLDTPQIRER